MELTSEFKNKVIKTVLERRSNYGGSDAKYAKSIGINPTSYNRIKNGHTDKVISDKELLRLGKELGVSLRKENWKIAKTSVYTEMQDNLNLCKEWSRSMILIDSWGIGKSFCARHIVGTMTNAFYLDCSQCKTKTQFVRELARVVGSDNKARYVDVKAQLKYVLSILDSPIIVLDDVGYLENPAFMEIPELWNATEGRCAWYLIGDDSLQQKIDRGINNKKVGYGALFSRFSDEYITLVPTPPEDRNVYLRKLIGDVVSANVKDRNKINPIINKCMEKRTTLRFVETLIRLSAA